MSNSLDAHCTHCLSGPKLELGQPAAQACAAARTLRRRRTGRRRRVNMVRQLCSGHVMLIVRLLLANTLLNQTVSSFTILGKLNNYRNSVLNTHGISKFSGICSVNTCKDHFHGRPIGLLHRSAVGLLQADSDCSRQPSEHNSRSCENQVDEPNSSIGLF